MKTGLVPAEPIWKVVTNWMRLNDVNQEGLAETVGTSSRNLFRFLRGEQETVTWAIADALVTKTVGPLYWHADPELRRVYWSVDMERLDLITPLDCPSAKEWACTSLIDSWDLHGSKRDAAKELGMDVGTYTRKLDEALVSVGREPASTPRAPKHESKLEAYVQKYTKQNAKRRADAQTA